MRVDCLLLPTCSALERAKIYSIALYLLYSLIDYSTPVALKLSSAITGRSYSTPWVGTVASTRERKYDPQQYMCIYVNFKYAHATRCFDVLAFSRTVQSRALVFLNFVTPRHDQCCGACRIARDTTIRNRKAETSPPITPSTSEEAAQ